MRSSPKWVFGTTRGLTARIAALFVSSLALWQPAKADTSFSAPISLVACSEAEQGFLDINLPKLKEAHGLAAGGQLQSAVLRFELLLNRLEGRLEGQQQSQKAPCESLRQYAFEVYSAYAFGLALTGDTDLAGPLVQQMVNEDIPSIAPLSAQNKMRLARFVERTGLLVLLPPAYSGLLSDLPSDLDVNSGADSWRLNGGLPALGAASTEGGPPSIQEAAADFYGSLLMRLGRESNVSFAPSRSTLNLFTDFGLIEVDLGDNFRQRSGWVGLLDGQLGRRHGLTGGLDLELNAAVRVRQTAVESGDTENLSLSGSLYGLNQVFGPSLGPEDSRSKDRLSLAYEIKTLFQQSVTSSELSYEHPVELKFARLEPLLAYRLVNYDFSASNARQMRLGLAMIPLHVSSVSVGDWGQIDYRPGVRLEWINDRAASPGRLGGEQFEGGLGVFVQAKWGKWYGEASANSGRRASESVYSNFLLPDARLLVERSSLGLVAKKMLNSSDSFVLSFQQDWQRSSIELFQSDNQGLYLGFERKF